MFASSGECLLSLIILKAFNGEERERENLSVDRSVFFALRIPIIESVSTIYNGEDQVNCDFRGKKLSPISIVTGKKFFASFIIDPSVSRNTSASFFWIPIYV